MKLEPLTYEQCEQVRLWRNAEMECWRTSQMLTRDMQEKFYDSLSERDTDKRYWAIIDDKKRTQYFDGTVLIGMGGINNIQWENRIGEITLIIDPARRKDGMGEKAVELLLDQAFNYLNLKTVKGECYKCNPAWDFWEKLTRKYTYKGVDKPRASGFEKVPNRKYFDGKYWWSLKFFIDKDDFNKIHNSK